MSHKNYKSLSRQVYERLHEMEGFGRSKHADKINGVDDKYIYSYTTMKTYDKRCRYFTDYVKSSADIRNVLGHKPRTIDECRQFVKGYIKHQVDRNLSPYTIRLDVAALEKLYGMKIEMELPQNVRAGITRSRFRTEKDKHFSAAKNEDLINFCKSCGPRRAELEKLSAGNLREIEGKYFISYEKGTKGGKQRLSPIVGSSDEIKRAVEYIKTLKGKNHVHGALDVHSLRAVYAARVYYANKQSLNSLEGKYINYTELTGKRDRNGNIIFKPALYICRKDKAGVVYDRAALLEASKALGHNREDVVAGHYLYNSVL